MDTPGAASPIAALDPQAAASAAATGRAHEVPAELRERLVAALEQRGGLGSVVRTHGLHRGDHSGKFAVTDADGKLTAFLIRSPAVDPTVMARAAARAREAREVLGSDLGSVILEPLDAATVDGLSHILLPYREPIPTGWRWRLVAWWLRGPVQRWLRDVTRVTLSQADTEPCRAETLRNLELVQAHADLSVGVRSATVRALGRLKDGSWPQVRVLCHGDFWLHNILLNRSVHPSESKPVSRFTVIDWPGANLAGFPMYDLVRLLMSFRVRPAAVRREVAAHCSILGCELVDAPGYLLASLGDLRSHLGGFPETSWVELTESCVGWLRGHIDP